MISDANTCIHFKYNFRYAGKKPDPQLQGDLQAWRAALNNLRAQQEHLGNRYVQGVSQRKRDGQ